MIGLIARKLHIARNGKGIAYNWEFDEAVLSNAAASAIIISG